MNPENTQKLIDAAPKLFSSVQKEAENRLAGRPYYSICFGCECSDGWFDLLLECATRIEAEINKLPADEQQHYVAHQIKEKFGTLRFYMSHETEEMSAIIRVAEEKSAITCEVCGSSGTLRPGGWIKTLCETCNGKPK